MASVDSAVRRFDSPERALSFERGRIDVITVAGITFAKGAFAPGWHWLHQSLEQPLVGRVKPFAGVVLSGRAKVGAGTTYSAPVSSCRPSAPRS